MTSCRVAVLLYRQNYAYKIHWLVSELKFFLPLSSCCCFCEVSHQHLATFLAFSRERPKHEFRRPSPATLGQHSQVSVKILLCAPCALCERTRARVPLSHLAFHSKQLNSSELLFQASVACACVAHQLQPQLDCHFACCPFVFRSPAHSDDCDPIRLVDLLAICRLDFCQARRQKVRPGVRVASIRPTVAARKGPFHFIIPFVVLVVVS